jgi:chemotaxis protein MotD
VSKIKLLPDETAQANLLNSAAARGTGKSAIRKIDKGKGLFNDVLGVVAKSVRTGTNTRPSSDDRTLQAPSIAFDRMRRSGHDVRAGAAEGDENDHATAASEAASNSDSPDEDATSIAENVPDPQRMMMLAADIRHVVDARMMGTAVRQNAASAPAAAPRRAEPDRGDSTTSAVGGDGPRGAHGVRGDNHVRGGPDRADLGTDAASVATTDSAANAAESISWAEIGADRDVPTKPTLGSLAASSGKVEVIQQQTHFAPVAAPSPLQQIGNAVLSELTATADASAPDVSSAVAGNGPAGDNQPLKVLTIRLDPPSLGEVTVNMRLQGDRLELHLMATQHDTLSMLQQNREALHDLMRDSGYVADVASVQRTDAVATTSNSQQTPQGSGNGQPNAWSDRARDGSGQPSTGGGASGGDDGHDRQQSARRDPQGASGDEAAHGRRGGVYL